jgi:hypothetical protein
MIYHTMSVTSKTKAWKLSSKFDDTDPEAKILESELLLTVKKSTLYAQLPVSKFPREDGYIMGVKLKKDIDVITENTPVVSLHMDDLEIPEKEVIEASEPVESFNQMKEQSRLANNKVAEYYKVLGMANLRAIKKEAFTDWFKNSIWRKTNGSLEKCMCPVCSLNLISNESFSAGHILPESKGGMMCIENIMPICPECNSQMGSRHLYWFAWHYYGKVMWLVY